MWRLLRMGVPKKDIGHLPLAAKVYITSLSLAALAISSYCVATWPHSQAGQFTFYLVFAIASSRMKVRLPGITSTLSVNYLFILTAVTDLSLPQTVSIGCAGGLAQILLSARKRPRNVQILFTLSSMTVGCALTHGIYHTRAPLGDVPFRLFWAAIVYFVSNTGSLAGIIALTEGKRFTRVWRESYFWTAPHFLVGAAIAGLLHVWNVRMGWHSSVFIFPTVFLIYHSYRLYLGRLEEEKRHVTEVADLHLRTINALAMAIDARDGSTHGHLRRVQVYARELARELGLSEEERRALDAAVLLHDIGKLAVPEYIISKPGKLTPEEFEKMKVHPVVGAEILDSVAFPYPVVPIVRAHHEKWDGSGYPSGLKSGEIPLGARILSAVDCLDALASDRQYRRALPVEEAMRQVASESGSSFDPRVIEVLKRRYVELERLAKTEVSAFSSLSTDIRIPNGRAPSAGFESSSLAPPENHPSFLSSIAAARQEFQLLLELTTDLARSLRVDEALALLASRLKAVIPYHGIAIYTVQGGRLVTRYAAGEDAAMFSSLEIPLGEGISGWVTQNNKPIINGNPSVEPGYLGDPSKFSVHRSALSVPLPGTEGVIGALTLYHTQTAAFTKEHLRILLAVSSKAGLTIENVLRFARAEETATTDALTGLPNAHSLFLRLDAALKAAAQQGTPLAVLVADVDEFKRVNDQFGHVSGNRILERTAEALRAVCRKGDEAARMGGDEFVLFLPDCEPDCVAKRVEQLDRLMAEAGRQVCRLESLRISVGAAYSPEDGTDAEELLAKADARMYEMKRQHHSSASRNLANLAQVVQDAGNRSFQLSLPPELEEFVDQLIQAGGYASVSAVIGEALQRLRESTGTDVWELTRR